MHIARDSLHILCIVREVTIELYLNNLALVDVRNSLESAERYHVEQLLFVVFGHSFNFVENHLTFRVARNHMQKVVSSHSFQVQRSDGVYFDVFVSRSYDLEFSLIVGVK